VPEFDSVDDLKSRPPGNLLDDPYQVGNDLLLLGDFLLTVVGSGIVAA